MEAPRVKVGWSPDDAAVIRLYRTRRRDHIPTAYKRLSDACSTPGAPVGLGGRAGSPRKMLATLTVEVDWDAQASRPRAGLLTYHFSTSYQATMAGRAYGGHGKPAVGRSEGAPSAECGLVILKMTSVGKGLIKV